MLQISDFFEGVGSCSAYITPQEGGQACGICWVCFCCGGMEGECSFISMIRNSITRILEKNCTTFFLIWKCYLLGCEKEER